MHSTLGSHYREVWKFAFKDAKAFWSAHRIATSVPSPTIGFIASAIVTKGIHNSMDLRQAIEVSVLSGAAGFLITFIVSLVKAPKLMDDERLAEIQKLHAALEVRKVPVSEQIQRDLTEEKLCLFSDQEKEVLKYILHHGETCPDNIVSRFGTDIVDGAIRKGRSSSLLIQGRGHAFCIRSEFAKTLAFHFHGE